MLSIQACEEEKFQAYIWSDIDFDKKTIYVCKPLAHVPKSGYMFTTLKTKNLKRQIPTPEFVLHELRTHKSDETPYKVAENL